MNRDDNISSAASEHSFNDLSDPRLSERRRRMFDLIRRLRNTGHADLDIPIIVGVGRQSAGKSSLIEAVSGIALPRAAGTCTRCPTEINLVTADEPWRCDVFLRRSSSKPSGAESGEISFGTTITEKSQVTERIRRAQRAILNPECDPSDFLNGEDAIGKSSRLFSTDCIVLQIRGREVTNLMFVDLPGLVPGGDDADKVFVDELVDSHVKRENCIMLVTVPGEADFKIQTAHRVAMKHDKSGARTIGVLTKPDRIPAGEENHWTGLITGADPSAGDTQWFVVKYPDSVALQQGITWERAREEELKYFALHPVWRGLGDEYRNRLGTDNLARRLSEVLSDLMVKKFPSILAHLEEELSKTKAQLDRMPPSPSDAPISRVVGLVSEFEREVEKQMQGVPEKDGLLQSTRDLEGTFQLAIRRTVPDYRPYKRNDPRPPPMPMPDFLYGEEDTPALEAVMPAHSPIFIDDVMAQADAAVTRELPDNYPFVVQRMAITKIIDQWEEPSYLLFQQVEKTLTNHILKLVNERFARYDIGELRQSMIKIVSEHIHERAIDTISRISFLLKVEHEPKIRNKHRFRDYHSKFKTFYRNIYRNDSPIATRLFQMEKPVIAARHSSNGTYANDRNAQSITMLDQTRASLSQLGFGNVQTRDLLSLLPPDPMDHALHIMADVRAYFQMAYQRFIDNVPNTIDEAFIRGVTVGLHDAILSKLGIEGPEGFETCRRLLQEPRNVKRRRTELRSKLARLTEARKEFLNFTF